MAQLILSRVAAAAARAAAPAALKPFAAVLARRAGAALGRRIDQALAPEKRSVGPRLTELHVQGSSEGESIPLTFGRMRLAGQVIWAARFKERAVAERSGGKHGRKTIRYVYSLSFAVGLCAGEAAGIGRVWANGAPFDMSTVAWRFHPGTEDQAPDPLIEAIEGADAAPAFRGLAYVVFEDLPLEAFDDAVPQLSFEVLRTPPKAPGPKRLEDLVQGVCLIPGAGEFAYARDIVRRVEQGRLTDAENCHADAARSDLTVALDDLARDAPQCRRVTLVVGWFGDDLRAGICDVRPGVDRRDKQTAPLVWRVAGVERGAAHLVSTINGAAAYGGSPSDESVRQAIMELKARGYEVALTPFLFMDVPAGVDKPDPNGAGLQAPYPWRGRIRPAARDGSAAVASEIDAFFGQAAPQHFSRAGAEVMYSGPAEWGWRRFVLHLASVAASAGGVDAFFIGSELRGLTTARDAAGVFPAVAHLRRLAMDVRAVLPQAALSYAADWSEYSGVSGPAGEKIFHLDPLWADDAIAAVAIDWYPPLTDWRDGVGHRDAARAASVDDPRYLDAMVEGGPDFDWYYASAADRAGQIRTPIRDGLAGEHWIWRVKDIRSFWANRHYDRPGGVRAIAPTAWVPMSKPIWFAEYGAPAIDKAGNAPNLFLDPKSGESAAPPSSSGARDDVAQRRAIEALLRHWDPDNGANPVSLLYGGPMIDLARACAWCWDARPYPAFPARADVWADAPAWMRGHWLNGRLGLGDLADVVADICTRAGVERFDVSRLAGIVAGYAVDAPSSGADALAPLMAAYAFEVVDRDGVLTFLPEGGGAVSTLREDDLCLDPEPRMTRVARGDLARSAAVRYIDPGADYRLAVRIARAGDRAAEGAISIDAPLALSDAQAEAIGQNRLAAQAHASAAFAVSPARLDLEPGDVVALDARGVRGDFRITRIEDGDRRLIEAVETGPPGGVRASAPASSPPVLLAPDPYIVALDLPPLPGAEEDARPAAAVVLAPWRALDLYVGDSAATAVFAGSAPGSAAVGALEWPLWPGPVGRFDLGNRVRLRIPGGGLASVGRRAALDGANLFAIGQADGRFELVAIASLELVGADLYDASILLRGLQGTEDAMGAPAPPGAVVVKIDARLARLAVGADRAVAGSRIFAAAAGLAPTSALRGWPLEGTKAWARPFAPAHLRASREPDGAIRFTWIRRARLGGDSWAVVEAPLGEERERYSLEILNGASRVRTVETESPAWDYAETAQIADFGGRPSWLRWRVAQISATAGPGGSRESSGPL